MAGYVAAAEPVDEVERQAAVDRSGVLERGRDPALVQLVRQAATKFHTAMAAISIIDRRRQRFAASIGLNVDETGRDVSFCAHAIHRPGEILVVPDATKDARFAGNPLVTGEPGIRFYAGKPLITREGYPLGTLCVIDTKPHAASSNLYDLTLLAFQAERLINKTG